MSQRDTGGANVGGVRKRYNAPAPSTTARTPTAPPRQADQGDTARSQPAPAPQRTRAFQPPLTVSQPFAQQQAQAQQRVRQSRRALPAPALAQPPIIHEPNAPSGRASTRPMTRAEVETFLRSQSEVTQAARHQIVQSIRANVGNVHGQQRVDAIGRLLDEVATDPRLAPTRAAIRHYTRLEHETARPQTTAEIKPGPPDQHRHLGIAGHNLATINTTAVARGAAKLGEKIAPTLSTGSREAGLVKNAVHDIGSLSSGLFVGAYSAAKAVGTDVVAGLTGDTHTHATADLAKAIVQSTAHEVTHPGESFYNHPILTVLDAAGAVSAGGRIAGAGARGLGEKGATGVRGKLDEHSHTVRPPLAMVDDAGQPVLVQRTHSKDATRRAAQVAADKRREPLRDHEGKPVTVTDRGRQVPVLKASEGERERYFKQRGDFIASRTNLSERRVREQASRATKVMGVKGRAARDIVSMVIEGTITTAKHFKQDLETHRQKLVDSIHEMVNDPTTARHSGELEAAQARLKLVEHILASPKAMAQAHKIVSEGERLGLHLNEGDAASVEAKIIDPKQARRAALSVTALEHLGGRHFTVEEHKALESAALDTERAAGEKLAKAKTPAERTAALGEVNAAREHRIAVSGREPEGVRKHEAVVVAHETLKARARTAHEMEAKAEQRVRDLATRHRSERGREAHHGPVAAYYVGPDRYVLRQDAVNAARAAGVSVRDIRRVATTAGEAKRVGELSQARRALAAAKQYRRAMDGAVKKAARGVEQNPLPETSAALRYGENNPAGKPAGAFLPNEDVENFLRSRGRDPRSVAYLTHRQDTRGARAHHTQFRPGTRPNLDNGDTRTGSAYRKGVTESSEKLIHDVGVRQAVQLNKARSIDKLVEEHGLRHPVWAKAQRGETLTAGEQRIIDKGGLFNSIDGPEAVERIYEDTGQRFTLVRAYQGSLPKDVQEAIREDYQGPGGMTTIASRLLNDRIFNPSRIPDARTRNLVMVPTELVERLDEHLRPAGAVEKFFQWLNRPFRLAVLPTPRWALGNFVEAYLVRLPTVGSGVNVPGLLIDMRATNRALKAMRDSGDPKLIRAADEIEAQQLGSGLFIGGKSNSVRRTADEVMPEFAQRAYGRIVAKLPVVGQLTELSRTAAHWVTLPLQAVFAGNLKFIESPSQRAAFGHAFRRDVQALTGSWVKSVTLSRQAVADAARGLVNTPAQQRFMQEQYFLLGMYSGFNPTLRAFVQSVTPFAAWMLASARFVYATMPLHNTAKTAFLLKVNEVVEQDWNEIHKDTPPGGLRDAIPNGHGGWIDLARFTPWGLTAPIARGDDLRSITGQFVPQFGGVINAAQGKDPFGRDLKVKPTADNPTGKPSNAQMAWLGGYDMLEAVVPYVSWARRLREHGETAYADSTVVSPRTKPGTSHGQSAVDRTFNPLRPTYLGGGGSTETEVPSAPTSTGPISPREAMLQRRAARMAARSQGDSRRQAMLERRAARLAAHQR